MNNLQINLLVHLARVDGHISESEKNLIRKIGMTKGVSYADIESIIEDPGRLDLVETCKDLSEEEKFEYLYNIVLLIKIDGRLYKEELDFCRKITRYLGYDDSVLFEFITKIYCDSEINTDRELVRRKVQRYLVA